MTPTKPGVEIGWEQPRQPSRRVSLGNLLQKVASVAGLDPQSLKRKGRMAKIVEARDRFICEAVLEEGYLAAELGHFLGCHPSDVSRVVQQALCVNKVRQV